MCSTSTKYYHFPWINTAVLLQSCTPRGKSHAQSPGRDKRATASIPAPQLKVLLLNVYDNPLKQGWFDREHRWVRPLAMHTIITVIVDNWGLLHRCITALSSPPNFNYQNKSLLQEVITSGNFFFLNVRYKIKLIPANNSWTESLKNST